MKKKCYEIKGTHMYMEEKNVNGLNWVFNKLIAKQAFVIWPLTSLCLSAINQNSMIHLALMAKVFLLSLSFSLSP